MSDETTPSVEEIKERLKVEIPVDEEPVSKAAAQDDSTVDIVAELRDLGKQFATTLETAWNSEERQRVENEVRDGLKSFVDEVDKMIGDVRGSKPAERVRTEASNMANRVEGSDIGRKAQNSVVQGLHWLSSELGKLADQFTPTEKAPDGDAPQDE
ncbi:MAG: hypothetical protein AAF614_13545 [Chloroflexota bacterium]